MCIPGHIPWAPAGRMSERHRREGTDILHKNCTRKGLLSFDKSGEILSLGRKGRILERKDFRSHNIKIIDPNESIGVA